MIIGVVIVWAMVLGLSPGLALIGSALTLLLLDRRNLTLINRLLDGRGG